MAFLTVFRHVPKPVIGMVSVVNDRDFTVLGESLVWLEKVEDMEDIMSYGIMSTPGVVIAGQVVHAGGIPSRQKAEGWFAVATA